MLNLRVLVAQAENPITSISRRLQQSEGMTARDLIIFAAIGAAVAVLVLALTFAGRALGWWSRATSASLFRELSSAHGLTYANRALLKRLARGHRLADLSSIFLAADKFEEDVLPAHLKHRSEEIAQLQERLFGSA
jgi:hypothetical protein